MIEQPVISRAALAKHLGVKTATIAKWERTWFPKPVQRVTDRLILYSVDKVEKALAARAARTLRRTGPRRT
jgi:hypothetical protein